MPSGLFYLKSLNRSISNRRDVWFLLIIPCFIEMPVFNANSVHLDQMPRSAASDLGLHCLLMSLLWDARHKWVEITDIDRCNRGEIRCSRGVNVCLFTTLIYLSLVRPTGVQEVAGLIPARSATFFRRDLTMKYFLRSFSPFR